MNPDHASRLRHQEQERLPALAQHPLSQTSQSPREFATPEDLLRHDSQSHPVPAEVAHRLNRSLAAEPRPAKSWLRRLFG